MSFFEKISKMAKSDIKTIVLPESNDSRIVEAAVKIQKLGIAIPILIGNPNEIQKNVPNLDISQVKILDHLNSLELQSYANQLYELRRHKGLDIDSALSLIKNPLYFGVMMVKMGQADGMVAGAINSTSNTLRPALQILKTAPNRKIVSAFFVMEVPNSIYGADGTFIYADSGLVENPNENELAEIALTSANSFSCLVGKAPKVAMLSYSTYGSAKSELTEKVVKATQIAKNLEPDIELDGEFQADAALIPEIRNSKAPESKFSDSANVLVFPDLNSGNIAYKLTQRLAKANAYGPITQGLSKPVNDLSRGCSSDDIVGVVAITAVQAQNINK